jgi:iron complex transport system substrate-binding protein
MSARLPFRPSGQHALLLTILLALIGCERQATHGNALVGTTQPARASTAATSNAAPQLHDWVFQPVIDEAERDAPTLRIVSAAPNITEICCALGLRPALVGRTRYCDYPPGIEAVTSIGALIDINIELLLELRPDLILVAGTSRAQIDRFAPLNLQFESVPDGTLNDLFAAIRRIGVLTRRERTAEQLCAGIERDLATTTARYHDVPAARVLLLTGTLRDPPRPPYVAGPGSFYDDLLRRAGHQNVVAGRHAAFAPLSLEFVVEADPDVVIELDPDGTARPNGEAGATRVWAKVGILQAVASGRVHVLTGNQHYLLGPRIALTYDALCRAIASHKHE